MTSAPDEVTWRGLVVGVRLAVPFSYRATDPRGHGKPYPYNEASPLANGQALRLSRHAQQVQQPMERSCVSVQEGYERWAPTYDRDPNPLLALEERQLKFMIPPMEGKRVLDLACGTGRWLAWLMSGGASLGVGVDSSPAMLAAAKEKSGVRRRLVQADCRAVPFANAVFDLVVCSFAVGHIPDLQSVAHEVGRVAAEGADVYVSDVHPRAYGQGWQAGFRDSRGAVEITTWPRSAQEFLAPWVSAGFDCAQWVECRFSEPERQVFAQAGKGHLFETYCTIPAILVCHFIRPAR